MTHLDRRTLLLMGGSALILAACGESSTQTAANGRADEAGLNVLHYGNGAEPLSLDPHFIQGAWEDQIVGDLMTGLVAEDAKGEPIPGTAESWETSPDGLTWTFHLRESVWSDGEPVTAGDFVFSFQRILTPKTAATYAYYLYLIKNAESVNAGKMEAGALGVTAPDAKTLVITLEHPAPYFIQYAAHMTMFPVPRHAVEAKGEAWSRLGNYVGNGPFTLTEWIPNDHITLQKNPRFYDAANVTLDRVVYYPTSDYLAALRRFRAGELDVQSRLPSQEIDYLRANLPETLRIGPVLTTEYLVVNQTRKPFDDVRVREALNLGVDRETITDKIRKMGEVPAYGVVPPAIANYPGGVVFAFKAMPQAERMARAQMLMTQAGYGPNNRLKTTLAIRAASADALRIPAAIQAMWKAIYVDAEIVQNDAAVFYQKVQQHDFDIGNAAWGADFNDPTTFLDILRKGNANNYGVYDNPKYDALMDQATKEQDLEKRGKILAEAEAIALKDQVWIPTSFWVSGAVVRPYVKGWEENPRQQHRARWMSIDPAARATTKFG